jgi:undecaprenyl-phosphate 4-deoxy-4-formamido-L-arabinose transferase
VYNGAATLRQLIDRLEPVLAAQAREYEVVLVNDGSEDSSWAVIEEIASGNSWVRGICLMRNFGQHNAVLCGIRAARYDVVVTLDDDLQHPPEEIPRLLDKLAEGYDVVYGIPRRLPHSPWRNLASRLTKWSLARAMGVRNIRDINAFRALRTDLRRAFAGYQSPHLLLDVLLSWGTQKFATVDVDQAPRAVGRSNYTLAKLFNQSMLVLTGFSTAPLRLATWVGFAFTLFGAAVLVYVIARYAVEGDTLPGFPFLASLIAIFSGAQLFSLGIMGEYLGRVFNRTLEQPVYVIDREVQFEAAEAGASAVTTNR